ncbi:MAG: indole-3-glycerol phosphate synthase TrpC [Candidatus Dormibacteraeota bacterium]|nr:indole-3-glycerol phosphate synthase TrpC [Candidatus Dormibacteraeota bacterium]
MTHPHRPGSDLLARLVEEAEAETARRRALRSEADLEAALPGAPPVRSLAAALRQPRLALIAETKRRTPTMGLLAPSYDPAALARTYAGAGADAISVLCQETSFGGEPAHLAAVRAASAATPVLRKDFVTTEHQLLEGRVLGADAVLLIVAALAPPRLESLLGTALDLGLEALVEVHDEAETEVALAAGARIIGINHRDLTTFTVDLAITERLRPRIPDDRVVVAESGIHGPEDATRMRAAGADAILVGELLMRSPDPGAVVRSLTMVEAHR